MKPKFNDKRSCLNFLQDQLGDDAARFESYAKRAEQWLTSNAKGKSSAGLSNPYWGNSPSDTVKDQKAWIENSKQCEKALYILNSYNLNHPKMTSDEVVKAITTAVCAWSGSAPYEGKRWKLVSSTNYSVAPFIIDHYRAANVALRQWEQLPEGEE